MKVDINKVIEIDRNAIRAAIQNQESVEIFSSTLTHEIEERFQRVLTIFLEECNQTQLFNSLSYCALELLSNANKANAKRLYFQERNLDIANSKDYTDGMQNFGSDLKDNKRHYISKLEEGSLTINLLLSSDQIITLKVINNSKITPEEHVRILDKIAKAKRYTSMEDAISDVDPTEGSGLGIIIIILMLQELGLDGSEHLTFETNETDTIATISIPLDSYVELLE